MDKMDMVLQFNLLAQIHKNLFISNPINMIEDKIKNEKYYQRLTYKYRYLFKMYSNFIFLYLYANTYKFKIY